MIYLVFVGGIHLDAFYLFWGVVFLLLCFCCCVWFPRFFFCFFCSSSCLIFCHCLFFVCYSCSLVSSCFLFVLLSRFISVSITLKQRRERKKGRNKQKEHDLLVAIYALPNLLLLIYLLLQTKKTYFSRKALFSFCFFFCKLATYDRPVCYL